MSPSSRTRPPTSPDTVVTRSVMVRHRIKQANCPLPNLATVIIMSCLSNTKNFYNSFLMCHLVLLKRMTGAALRLVTRASPSKVDRVSTFCVSASHIWDT